MTSLESPERFAALVQDFFCRRLIGQQNVSHRTISAYRDALRLLFGYLHETRNKPPSSLTLSDLDAETIAAFLDHLEAVRGNSVRTRNARFAVIRALLKYAAAQHPESLHSVQRVLSIPMKRYAKPTLCYLSRDEITAVLEAPDTSTWSGHRDHVLFSLLYNTGARVSEATALRWSHATVDSTRRLVIEGKGRKQRVVPLWRSTSSRLREWASRVDSSPCSPVFPNRFGVPMSRSGVERRLRDAVRAASATCRSLTTKRVSPHTLRHTTAMHLLQSGVDITVIALWLGHESPVTTHQYVEANLAMKDRALARLEEVPTRSVRFRPGDDLLRFLEGL